MHFLPDTLEAYITDHSENEPEVLQKLRRETHLKVIQPRMITGHYQGRVLSMLAKLIRPQKILEIGTYTGYSAICLAEGLEENGIVHTIDINKELYDIQRKYFDQSGYGHQIIQHTGDALSIIPQLEESFDLVFIDAEKKKYRDYYESAILKTTKGAVIISDNVLWSGKVIEPLGKKDITTRAVLEYNKHLKDDPRVDTLLLSVRDGLTLCRVR